VRTVIPESRQTSCEWVAQLLPWYLNGTLAAAERRLVDAHCSGCERCSSNLRFEQRVVEAIREPHDTIGHSSQAAWQRFEALLDQSPAPPRPSHPFRFRMVVLAQAAAVVALAVLLFVERSAQEAPRFQTLTNADATLAIRQPLVRVALDAGVSENEAAAMASTLGGKIVAGPSVNNIYTFAFDPGLSTGDLEEKVATLRRQGAVLLAEPVAPGPQ
jgi:hypothetical protein